MTIKRTRQTNFLYRKAVLMRHTNGVVYNGVKQKLADMVELFHSNLFASKVASFVDS